MCGWEPLAGMCPGCCDIVVIFDWISLAQTTASHSYRHAFTSSSSRCFVIHSRLAISLDWILSSNRYFPRLILCALHIDRMRAQQTDQEKEEKNTKIFHQNMQMQYSTRVFCERIEKKRNKIICNCRRPPRYCFVTRMNQAPKSILQSIFFSIFLVDAAFNAPHFGIIFQ